MPYRRVLTAGAAAAGLFGAAPALAGETITYTYDARGRLVAVDHDGGPSDDVRTTYTYDQADNRTNVTVTGASGGSGGGPPGASLGPQYRLRYVFNGRFYVSILAQ